MPGTRTRFAPSPTGHLHIGNARTALFNWLFSRHFGGSFILRIEDTDIERSDAAYERSILEDLSWLGLSWDEGPDINGPRGPFRQSERLSLYREYAERLVEKGLAYRCFCTKERLESLKKEQLSKGVPPRYDNRCRTLHATPAPSEGVAPALRFAVPARGVHFDDGVHGPLSFDASAMGDFVIIGSDGAASYNFAVVVDDAAMEITHILRGDDHLSNTPRQLLVFEALGLRPPRYFHLPLVLSPQRAPLSKRDEGASVRALREEGFLPGALLNTVARLGWSPGAEGLLPLDDMARAFDGGRLSKSASVFDLERLRSYNKAAIGGMDGTELLRLASVPDKGAAPVAEAVKTNASTLNEFRELLAPFTGEAEPDEQARAALSASGAGDVLLALKAAIELADAIDENSYDKIISEVKSKTGARGRALFMPIRAALTGRTEGIELVTVFRLLGKERVLERLGRLTE